MGDEQGPDGGGDDAGDDDVPAARVVHGEDDRKQRREDGRQRVQPFLALGDEQGELYEFTVRFTHAECVVTDYTDSTEAGMAETLESITALCAEEAGLDYDAPTPEALGKFLQGIGGYKIAEENLYRFEAGVFNQACEEFYELLFTRRVCARSGNWELTICFYYPPEAQLEEYSDLVCADDPDSFVKEVLASEALQTVLTRYKPMRVRVHAEQV